MTEFLLALIPAVLLAATLGYLLWRSDGRLDAAQAKHETLLTATLDEWAAERKEMLTQLEAARTAHAAEVKAERASWANERAQLLNRIQKPETAVYENYEPQNLDGHVPFDNDEAYWEARQARAGVNGADS